MRNVTYAIERGKGKSTRAVYLSEYFNSPILVVSNDRRENILALAERLGVTIPTPITVTELGRIGKHIDNYIVDEADDVLSSLVAVASNGCVNNPAAMFVTPNVKN